MPTLAEIAHLPRRLGGGKVAIDALHARTTPTPTTYTDTVERYRCGSCKYVTTSWCGYQVHRHTAGHP